EDVAEDRLAREDGQDLGDDAEGRQDEDVDLRMAEGPEEMLPEERVAAVFRLEEARAEVAVEEEEDRRRRQARQGEEQEEVLHERRPDEEGQAIEAHAGAAHLQRRDDDVDRTGDRRDAEE